MGLTLKEQKAQLRKQLAEARSSLSGAERQAADAGIAENLCATSQFQNAETVFTYLSMGAEVDTRQIIEQAWSMGKTVAIPRCIKSTRTMTWHTIESFDNLVKSSFGIDEPAEDAPAIDPSEAPNAIALVPGFSFDERGYRIGYGGGFYDVFLEQFSGTSIGLCRAQFKSAEPLPCEKHDLAVDLVITE